MFQSDTAGVKVPELDLELASGTLGGVVTTVEGLITKISESKHWLFSFVLLFCIFLYGHLSITQYLCAGLERVHGFTFGDSLDEYKKTKWQDFKVKLKKVFLIIMTSTQSCSEWAVGFSFWNFCNEEPSPCSQLLYDMSRKRWRIYHF